MPFHGNLIVDNSELVRRSFDARVAVTRTACLNSTIGQSIFSSEHYLRDLHEAIGGINKYVTLMRDNLVEMQLVPIANPLEFLLQLGKVLNLPPYAYSAALDYWTAHGQGVTLYDLIQAIAAGSRGISLATHRHRANWGLRTVTEGKLWGIASELKIAFGEGETPENWYLSGEELLRHRILNVVRSYEPVTPVAGEIAAQIELLEI